MLAVALRTLSARSDGRGLDERDAPLGDTWAITDPATWTPWQARAAWKMLGKYHHRLADGGIDYYAIPEPSARPPEAAGRNANRVEVALRSSTTICSANTLARSSSAAFRR